MLAISSPTKGEVQKQFWPPDNLSIIHPFYQAAPLPERPVNSDIYSSILATDEDQRVIMTRIEELAAQQRQNQELSETAVKWLLQIFRSYTQLPQMQVRILEILAQSTLRTTHHQLLDKLNLVGFSMFALEHYPDDLELSRGALASLLQIAILPAPREIMMLPTPPFNIHEVLLHPLRAGHPDEICDLAIHLLWVLLATSLAFARRSQEKIDLPILLLGLQRNSFTLFCTTVGALWALSAASPEFVVSLRSTPFDQWAEIILKKMEQSVTDPASLGLLSVGLGLFANMAHRSLRFLFWLLSIRHEVMAFLQAVATAYPTHPCLCEQICSIYAAMLLPKEPDEPALDEDDESEKQTTASVTSTTALERKGGRERVSGKLTVFLKSVCHMATFADMGLRCLPPLRTYVGMKVGEQYQKTPIEETQNPEYNFTFTFEVKDVARDTLTWESMHVPTGLSAGDPEVIVNWAKIPMEKVVEAFNQQRHPMDSVGWVYPYVHESDGFKAHPDRNHMELEMCFDWKPHPKPPPEIIEIEEEDPGDGLTIDEFHELQAHRTDVTQAVSETEAFTLALVQALEAATDDATTGAGAVLGGLIGLDSVMSYGGASRPAAVTAGACGLLLRILRPLVSPPVKPPPSFLDDDYDDPEDPILTAPLPGDTSGLAASLMSRALVTTQETAKVVHLKASASQFHSPSSDLHSLFPIVKLPLPALPPPRAFYPPILPRTPLLEDSVVSFPVFSPVFEAEMVDWCKFAPEYIRVEPLSIVTAGLAALAQLCSDSRKAQVQVANQGGIELMVLVCEKYPTLEHILLNALAVMDRSIHSAAAARDLATPSFVRCLVGALGFAVDSVRKQKKPANPAMFKVNKMAMALIKPATGMISKLCGSMSARQLLLDQGCAAALLAVFRCLGHQDYGVLLCVVQTLGHMATLPAAAAAIRKSDDDVLMIRGFATKPKKRPIRGTGPRKHIPRKLMEECAQLLMLCGCAVNEEEEDGGG